MTLIVFTGPRNLDNQTNCLFSCRSSHKGVKNNMNLFKRFSYYFDNTESSYNLLYLRHLCREVYSFCISVCPFVCMIVRSSVTLTKITSKVCVKVSQMGISQQPRIRKLSYLGHGYLGGSVYIPWILAQGSMHRGWAGCKSPGHPKTKSVILLFLLRLPLLKTLGQTSVIHMSQPFVSRDKGQSDIYFMVEWFCLISWKRFDGWMS